MSIEKEITKKYFFVDESGDFNLFNKKGQMIVGKEGVSNFLMVGVADVSNPKELNNGLTELRKTLMTDPYFKDVPSMQPSNRKTSLLFHAKNDLPEVRREVFKLLKSSGIKVVVAIRRKIELAKFAKAYFEMKGKKLTENDIYDDLIKRLFRNLLTKQMKILLFFQKEVLRARTKLFLKQLSVQKQTLKWLIIKNLIKLLRFTLLMRTNNLSFRQ